MGHRSVDQKARVLLEYFDTIALHHCIMILKKWNYSNSLYWIQYEFKTIF